MSDYGTSSFIWLTVAKNLLWLAYLPTSLPTDRGPTSSDRDADRLLRSMPNAALKLTYLPTYIPTDRGRGSTSSDRNADRLLRSMPDAAVYLPPPPAERDAMSYHLSATQELDPSGR